MKIDADGKRRIVLETSLDEPYGLALLVPGPTGVTYLHQGRRGESHAIEGFLVPIAGSSAVNALREWFRHHNELRSYATEPRPVGDAR